MSEIHTERGCLDPYEELANAVIILACNDYRTAVDSIKRYKRRRDEYRMKEAKDKILELERFFHSDWFGIMTTLDPEFLIGQLHKESGITPQTGWW